MSEPAPASPPQYESTVIETIQSLIVAFVLAMTFRGFVTEGFVIPTGSMAPTLMGEHFLLHSEQTGVTFTVGNPDPEKAPPALDRVPDPILGPDYYGSGTSRRTLPPRMGDRILVLKSLYPFSEPDRFDVVVFKNPTDPTGKSANYIKRLVGLPNEKIWLADGDVFAAPNEDDVEMSEYRVQRKPEHVQRAVWQLVHASDFVPSLPGRLDRAYRGPPWRGRGWDTSGRSYRCDTAEPTTLSWDTSIRQLNDWTSYDAIGPHSNTLYSVSDLRLRAGVVAVDPLALRTTFQIEARDHRYQFVIADGQGQLRLQRIGGGAEQEWQGSDPVPLDLPEAGDVFTLEFWHVDQMLSMYVNGKRVLEHPYEWSGIERMEFVSGLYQWRDFDELTRRRADQPQVEWRFAGSPVTLHGVRMDRDLYYRPAYLDPNKVINPTPAGHGFETLVERSNPAYGTHPENPAALGPDHFFMLGDNSQASLDSRLWGNAHPLVAQQIDPRPFVTHRKLIIGKAWVVYFPAPFSLTDTGVTFIPDFGRLRFIR